MMIDQRAILVDTIAEALRRGVPSCKGKVDVFRSIPVWDFDGNSELPIILVDITRESVTDDDNLMYRIESTVNIIGYVTGADSKAARKASKMACEIDAVMREWQYIVEAHLDPNLTYNIPRDKSDYIINSIVKSGTVNFDKSQDGQKPCAVCMLEYTATYYLPQYSDGELMEGAPTQNVFGKYQSQEGRFASDYTIDYRVDVEGA